MEKKNGKRKKILTYFEKYHNEYGSISPCILNSYKKKPDKNGNITYYYISPNETENTIKLNGLNVIPVTVTEKEYRSICACDWKEYKTNKIHAEHDKTINKYYDDEGVEKEKNLPRAFYETTSNSEKQWCEDMDFKNIIKTLSPIDRKIALCIKYGYTQKDIAEVLNISQGTVSKKLNKINYVLLYDKYDNGERTKQEIEYEIAWDNFLRTNSMPHHEEITLEIYKRLIPLGSDLYYLKRFTIKSLQYFAYKVLFFYSSFDKESVENEIKLLQLERQEFYHKYIENEQDIYKYLFAKLETEALRIEKKFGKTSASFLTKIKNRAIKYTKHKKITSKEFLNKTFTLMGNNMAHHIDKAHVELPKPKI